MFKTNHRLLDLMAILCEPVIPSTDCLHIVMIVHATAMSIFPSFFASHNHDCHCRQSFLGDRISGDAQLVRGPTKYVQAVNHVENNCQSFVFVKPDFYTTWAIIWAGSAFQELAVGLSFRKQDFTQCGNHLGAKCFQKIGGSFVLSKAELYTTRDIISGNF